MYLACFRESFLFGRFLKKRQDLPSGKGKRWQPAHRESRTTVNAHTARSGRGRHWRGSKGDALTGAARPSEGSRWGGHSVKEHIYAELMSDSCVTMCRICFGRLRKPGTVPASHGESQNHVTSVPHNCLTVEPLLASGPVLPDFSNRQVT